MRKTKKEHGLVSTGRKSETVGFSGVFGKWAWVTHPMQALRSSTEFSLTSATLSGQKNLFLIGKAMGAKELIVESNKNFRSKTQAVFSVFIQDSD